MIKIVWGEIDELIVNFTFKLEDFIVMFYKSW